MGVVYEEMLHTEPHSESLTGWNGAGASPLGTAAEPFGCHVKVAEGSGKSHTSWVYPCHGAKAHKLTDYLISAVCPREGMDLVDYNVPQVPEKSRQVVWTADEHSLKRLGSDLQNSRRLVESFCFVRSRNVPVPVEDGYSRHIAKLGDSGKLVVYQGFQRCDVENAEG